MWPAERVREPVVRGGPRALRLMTGLAAVSCGALLIGVIWVGHRNAVPADDPIGDVVKVGVVPGQSVPGYLRSSGTELAALTDPSAPASGDIWALVSLDSYVPPGELPGLLGGAAVAQAYARVPLADTHTQAIRLPVYLLPADVMSGMLDAALTRDREQAEYLQLARRLAGDGAGYERARRAYETAARTAAAEASAYRSGCSCVFAAVVRGTPQALREIAERTGVRIVDPAPEVRRLDRAEFRPPRPEETGTVTAEPSPAPVPNARSGIASRTPTPIMSSPGDPVTSDSSLGSGIGPHTSPTAGEERAAVTSAPDTSAAQDGPTGSSAAPRAPSGR